MQNTVFSTSQGKKHLLSDVLLRFSDHPADVWRLSDAVRGTQIFGSIGSGKTSGSGKTIAKAYLENGYGGLVLCAKNDEAKDWQKLAQKCGRGADLILFGEGSQWQFNPLQYETTRGGRGAGLTFNLTELFMSVFKMGQRLSGGTSEEKERFWDNSLKRCINRIIDLLKLAEVELSIANMVEVLSLAPQGNETLLRIQEMEDPDDFLKWAEKDFFIHCLCAASGNAESEQQKRDLELVKNYFLRDFANLDDRVRSTISEMFLGFCEPFLGGILRQHFAEGTNLLPEMTFEGKIIVLDFSVKDYLVSGVYAQCIFKLLWQQAVERRRVDDHTVPVFSWLDESQYFINEYDTIFQTTSRSSRALTVLLTQSISNYYSYMGGNESKSKVDSLLGNLGMKVFHANVDSETNDWASKLIGNDLIAIEGGSVQNSAFSFNVTRGESYSTQLLPQVLPLEFTTLKSGGEESNFEVQGIITLSGRQWSNGKNYRKVTFKQSAIF